MILQKVYDLVFENGIYKTSKNNSLVMNPQELFAQELKGTQWYNCEENTWRIESEKKY